MRKIVCFIALSAMLFTGCSDASEDFGVAYSYSSFLWVDAKSVAVEKTFDFEFSKDAVDSRDRFAEFTFIDNEGKPVSQKELKIYVDDELAPGNRFLVKSGDKSKCLRFEFTPEAKKGTHQGYLRLGRHNLHRLGNQELRGAGPFDAFQWTLKYDKKLNPLVVALIWLGILLASLLFLLFMVLRLVLYPHFGRMKRVMILKQDGATVCQRNIVFTGARRVVFAQKKVKQSIWKKLFVGKTVTVVDPRFIDNLTFTPRKRKKAVVRGNNYDIQPNPMPYNGKTVIKNPSRKLEITLQ